MVKHRGFVNIYRSGMFHREGKPTAYNRHPGDIYPTQDEALQDIDPRAAHLYVCTVPIAWAEPMKVQPNPRDSVPKRVSKRTPMHVTH